MEGCLGLVPLPLPHPSPGRGRGPRSQSSTWRSTLYRVGPEPTPAVLCPHVWPSAGGGALWVLEALAAPSSGRL